MFIWGQFGIANEGYLSQKCPKITCNPLLITLKIQELTRDITKIGKEYPELFWNIKIDKISLNFVRKLLIF